MHFHIIKLKTLKIVAFILLVCVTLAVNWGGNEALASVFFYKPVRKVPIYCVETDTKNIAISFDAAWGSDKTQDIINILNGNNIPATFFLVGMWVDKNEEMVKKIDEAGFEIGTHSNLHPDMTKLSSDKIKLELESSVKKIEDITGKKVKVFRAPYGAYNNTLLNVAESLNLKTIQWDVDSLDWKGITASQICSNIITKTKSGSIILCHNNADHIVEALPSIITTLKSRGYNFVRMSELVYSDNYTIDQTGKQIKN